MTFDEYESAVLRLAIYPNLGRNFVYPALGIAGEAGEVVENVKKALRDDYGVLTPERREKVLKELGDVLWYIAAEARECGSSLQEVAEMNRSKLLDRKSRGVLHGEGDDR